MISVRAGSRLVTRPACVPRFARLPVAGSGTWGRIAFSVRKRGGQLPNYQPAHGTRQWHVR